MSPAAPAALLSTFVSLCAPAGPAQPPAEPPRLREVPFTHVTIDDAFWSPRRAVNRTVSLQHSLDKLESTGAIANFDLAAANKRDGYRGPVYSDSDLFKTLEAVSYSLATDPDPALAARLESIIARVAAAQHDDGYLNSWYAVNAPGKRFTNLRDHHELYCAGHLFEAAVAHHQATNSTTLLDVATRYADLIDRTFRTGPAPREGYPGHPEIELALVKLWRTTGERRYFDLARHFIDARGVKFFAKEHSTPAAKYNGEYWQDNAPVREHTRVTGHAVRFAYLLSGALDVAAETGDRALLDMNHRVWDNTLGRNTYITGGIGPSAHNEGFTTDFDLPNHTAYQETCASVAMVLWNHRLALAYADSRYADAVETALYNGVLAGVSQDGTRFFYVNPLESKGTHHRSAWFGCACCPPNVCRTLAALGGYAYAASDDALFVNLFIQGSVRTDLNAGPADIAVATDYPWDGKIDFTIKAAPAQWSLMLRAPAWCDAPRVLLNGKPTNSGPPQRGYLPVANPRPGDVITLDLPMPVRRVESRAEVAANRGRLAITRGPLVYCVEAIDTQAPLEHLRIPRDAALTPTRRDGIVVLQGAGLSRAPWTAGLYRPAQPQTPVLFTAVPYYTWDNRAPGAMMVWLPE